MHHCLQIVEILHLIFEFFRIEHERKLETLANLAVTCRTFSEPALDALWHSISSLNPLRMLMPDDLWEPVSRRGQQWTLRRIIQTSDFERWPTYTGRVRRICRWIRIQTFPQVPISHSREDSQLLATARLHGVQLFYNLQELSIRPTVHQPASETPIHAYLAPSIKSLKLFVDFPEPAFDAMCEDVRQSCPSLEKLSCRSFSLGSPWPNSLPCQIPAFSTLTSDLKHLQELRCCDINIPDHVIRHLSQLPTLRILDLGNTVDDFVGCLKGLPRFSSAPFPSLRYLELFVLELSNSTLELVEVISNNIQQLTLKHGPVLISKEQRFRSFFQTLANTKWKDSMRFLSLQGEVSRVPQYSEVWTLPDYRVTAETLKPLLLLPNLEAVDLDLEVAFELNNAILKDMAQAWPRLSTLKIGGGGGTWGIIEGGAKITLDGLVPLVHHCPNLETLSICLNAVTAFPSPRQRPGRGMVNKHVQCLHLCNSTISDPVEVASFLSDLFPNLSTVTAWSEGWLPTEDPDTEIEQWDEVNKLLPAFRNVRQQERAFRAVDDADPNGFSVPMDVD